MNPYELQSPLKIAGNPGNPLIPEMDPIKPRCTHANTMASPPSNAQLRRLQDTLAIINGKLNSLAPIVLDFVGDDLRECEEIVGSLLTPAITDTHAEAEEPALDETFEADVDDATDALADVNLDDTPIPDEPEPFVHPRGMIVFRKRVGIGQHIYRRAEGGDCDMPPGLTLAQRAGRRYHYIKELQDYRRELEDSQAPSGSDHREECKICARRGDNKEYKHEENGFKSGLIQHVENMHIFTYETPVNCKCATARVWNKDKNEWETIKCRSQPITSYNRLYNHCRQSKLHNFQKYPELLIESPAPEPATAPRRVAHVEPEEEEEEETQTPQPLFIQRGGNVHMRGLDA